MIGSLVGFVVFLLVLGGIGAVIFFSVRGGSGDAFAFRNLLRAYLRLAYFVSLLVFMVGAVMTLTSAFSATFGHDFSYSTYFSGSAVYCSPGAKCAQPLQEDPRPKQDLIRGLSLMIAGAIFGVAHRAGHYAMESPEERSMSGLAKAEYLVGTIGFGLVSIIALPAAAYAVLNFNLVSDVGKNGGGDVPGNALAVALVFLPAWAYYLLTFVKRVRSSHPVPVIPSSPGMPTA